MRILIIRHGDPDYAIDGLTEKGKVEVELLAKKMAKLQDILLYRFHKILKENKKQKKNLLLKRRIFLNNDGGDRKFRYANIPTLCAWKASFPNFEWGM